MTAADTVADAEADKELEFDEDGLVHTECDCTPNLSFCGLWLAGPSFDSPAEENLCVVCEELDKKPCERCGE